MTVYKTGPYFWQRELAKGILWEHAYREMCRASDLYQDMRGSRFWVGEHQEIFRRDCLQFLGWAP